MDNFDYCIFIGRFAPIHNGHLALIKEALNRSKRVIVITGSVNKARDIKNPWTAAERTEMIQSVLTPDELKRVDVIQLRDHLYNEMQWIAELTSKVYNITGDNKNIALIGHEYDSSSYYLRLFPQWTFLAMKNFDEFPHATQIREAYFTDDSSYKDSLQKNTIEYLGKFKETEHFKKLKDEFVFLKEYKSKWANSPFQPIFHTVDSVVIKSGHILLVRRKGKLGKGLLALPGGFLNADESLKDGAIRELKEETAIRLTKSELNDSIVEHKIFDLPSRSLRGRTITTAFLMDLKSGMLPYVKGTDDAEKAFWLPINEVYMKDTEFFEDHWHIITFFVSRY